MNINDLTFFTSFRFSSKKKKREFFIKLLLEDDKKFLETQIKYFNEKLNVVFSWYMLCKYTKYLLCIIAILAALSHNFGLAIANFGLSAVFAIGAIIFLIDYTKRVPKYIFTVNLNAIPEFLQEYKESVKESNKINI